MTLIISKPGMKTKKVGNSSFDRESSLQNYISENPESIPVGLAIIVMIYRNFQTVNITVLDKLKW